MTFASLAITLTVMCGQTIESEHMPKQLLWAANARHAFDTAVINWRELYHQWKETVPYHKYWTSRYAGEQRLDVYRGDEQGCTMPNSVGYKGACAKRFSLTNMAERGEVYIHIEASRIGGHFENVYEYEQDFGYGRVTDLRDLRMIGLTSHTPFNELKRHWLEAITTAGNVGMFSHWESGYEGDLFVVKYVRHEATYKGSQKHAWTWTLDPEKNWNCVEFGQTVDGIPSTSVPHWRTDYELYDGVWFLSRVEMNLWGGLSWEMEVLSASFNQPEHPEVFIPEDIGWFPGIRVQRVTENTDPNDGGFMHRWANGQYLTSKEFRDIQDSLDLTELEWLTSQNHPGGYTALPRWFYDATWLAENDVEMEPGLWEEYINRFICKYVLDGKQRKKAWELLRECQDRAYGHWDEHKEDFEKNVERRQEALESGDKQKIERAEKSQKRLLEPFNIIFEKRLKRGLEKIPTKKQREAADRLLERKEELLERGRALVSDPMKE